MPLRLTITSSHARSLGERATQEFGPQGGTIGRSLQSDWVLPDGQRYVSSRHASIDFRSGSYYLVDTSTNGVFVNGSEQAVGRGKPQRLFNGDRVRIGEYEMSVEIDDDDDSIPLTEERHVDPVDLAQRVEAPDPTSCDLVDAYEITGVGFEELLTEDEADTLTPPSKLDSLEFEIVEDPPARKAEEPQRESVPRPQREAAPRPQACPQPAQAAKTVSPAAPPPAQKPPVQKPAAQATTPSRQTQPSSGAPSAAAGAAKPSAAPAASARASTGDSHALDAFFRGAGLPPRRLDPEQAEAVLHRLGQIAREMILGVSESLHLRAEQKNALRLANTTIQPQDNNPLKFSAGLEEMLTNLLFRQSQEYLPPVEAVREAYADIRVHQQALLKSLRAALDAYSRRLDPDDLEQKFSRGKSGRLMGAANKLKYWDLYKDLYQIVAHHPPGELPAQFLEDFARAYEDETERASPREAQKQAQAG